jgi:hypothetical protein
LTRVLTALLRIRAFSLCLCRFRDCLMFAKATSCYALKHFVGAIKRRRRLKSPSRLMGDQGRGNMRSTNPHFTAPRKTLYAENRPLSSRYGPFSSSLCTIRGFRSCPVRGPST